jgi:hypothetical protein
MEGEEITKLELSTDKLVDPAFGITHTQGFDLNVDLHSIDVDDVAPPAIKLSDAKRHASLLSNLLLINSLHFGVNEILSFQKLVGNLDEVIVANLGRQNQRSMNSYFKNSLEYLYLFGVMSYYFIQCILFKLVVHVLKFILLMFLYSLDSTTLLGHLSY